MPYIQLSVLKNGIRTKKRGFLVNAILFFSFFTWYYVFFPYVVREIASRYSYNLVTLQLAYNFVIVAALLLTSYYINRINRVFAIYGCSIVTSVATMLLFFIPNDALRLTIVFITAALFGLGQISFFTYFWNSTLPEERGRIGGLIGFVTLPFYFFVSIGVASVLDFSGLLLLSMVIGMMQLFVVFLKPRLAISRKRQMMESFFEKRTILLYLIPWFVFSLINATLAKDISLKIAEQVSASFYIQLSIVQLISALSGTLIGGIIADLFGRRIPLAVSLTLYGISSALPGILNNYAIFYFAYAANGISWGILLTLYSFVVWGDLSSKENCAKMYSIGLATLYSTISLGLLFPEILGIPVLVSSLTSCLLIFLSNIPIFLAPELLDSSFRERIKLKLHMNAVKKVKKSKNQG